MSISFFLVSYFLRMLAILSFLFIFIPLLVPINFLLYAILLTLSYIIRNTARYYKKKNRNAFSKDALNKIHKINQQNTRIGLISLSMSLILYAGFRLHINLCYIKSLDEELNPLRKIYRKPDISQKKNEQKN